MLTRREDTDTRQERTCIQVRRLASSLLEEIIQTPSKRERGIQVGNQVPSLLEETTGSNTRETCIRVGRQVGKHTYKKGGR